MYKLLLCWRYLRTRYIALASIISVMLGVATMIVVNSVMEGFTHEMKDRIHGILSDLVFESQSLDGFPDADRRMAEIRKVAGEYISGMSPTVHIPAMLGYSVGSQYVTRQITMIGVDEATYATVSDFGQFLQHPQNRKQLDFRLKDGGYDTVDHQATDPSKVLPRHDMQIAGWKFRRRKARYSFADRSAGWRARGATHSRPITSHPVTGIGGKDARPAARWRRKAPSSILPTSSTPAACWASDCVRFACRDGSDGFLALPGDDVEISYPTSSKPPKVLSAKFTCVDFYESKMNEYDSSFVFVPIKKLQELRGMVDPSTASRQLQRDSNSAQAGRRSRQGSRLAAGQFPAANLQDQLVAR